MRHTQKNSQPPRLRAFTLVEVLVVVSVIALLLAIMLPALRSARRNAQRAICGCHLREIGISLDLYAQTHEEWYPTAESPDSRGGPTNWWENSAFLLILAQTPRPQGRSILTCPAHRHPGRCPDGTVKDCWGSYGANTSAFGMRRGRSKRGRRRNQIQHPARALAFCDARGESYAPHAVGWQGCVVDNFAFRHNQCCTVVYADTHVDWIRQEEVPRCARAWEQPFWGNMPCFDKP